MVDREILFTSLLVRHHSMLWRMCWRRSGKDTECCKDLMQEVAIDLWKNLDKLRPDASAQQERAWVGWRARSVFFRIGRTKQVPLEQLTDDLVDNTADSDSRHLDEILDSCIASLSDNDQQMVRLYLEGYNADEIGQKIGTSRDAVYQRMRRAIKKMRHSVLVLAMLLATAATAIAVVPQWSKFFVDGWRWFFGNDDDGGNKASDTANVKNNSSIVSDTLMADSLTAIETNNTEKQIQKVAIEQLPVMDVLQMLSSPDTIWVADIDSRLTLSTNGESIIITGKTGERIRVYDKYDKLVAQGVANGLCILNLFPDRSLVLNLEDWYFRLQIGKRAEILLTGNN